MTAGAIVGAFTVRLSALELLPAEFVAVAVNVETPTAVGVPLIAPVEETKLRPAGNDPLVTLHVIGVVPVAANVSA